MMQCTTLRSTLWSQHSFLGRSAPIPALIAARFRGTKRNHRPSRLHFMAATQSYTCRRCVLAHSIGTFESVRFFSDRQGPETVLAQTSPRIITPLTVTRNRKTDVPKSRRKLDPLAPILTLDPDKFAAVGQQIVDFSRKSWTIVGSYSKPIKFPTPQSQSQAFPPGSRGYMYYRKPLPGEHDMNGALRLRLMPSSALSFAEGKDLQCIDGTPWKVGIYAIVQFGTYAPILKMLLQESAVTEFLVAHIKKMPRHRFGMRSVVLFSPSDTFVTNMHNIPRCLNMVAIGSMALSQFPRTVFHSKSTGGFPFFKGLLRLRLERSPLPQHAKSCHAVIRVIEIIEPVEHIFYDTDVEIAEPVEGELLRKRYKGKKEHEICTYNIRSSSYQVFENFFGNGNPFK